MRFWKTVIHLHTSYSHDSNLTPATLVAHARRESVDCVAITDHNEIAGALAVRALGGVRVIVGEEITTADGHLIGLFLERAIRSGRSAEATIDEIHAQGGLALAPHPFCTLCALNLGAATERIAARLDAVEIHSAQNPLPWQDRRAARFAQRRGLAAYAGSDGHLRGRLAPAYQWMEAFSDPSSFLDSLRAAQLVCGRFGLLYLARMGLRHVWDKFAPGPLPGFGVHCRTRGEVGDDGADSTLARGPGASQPRPAPLTPGDERA